MSKKFVIVIDAQNDFMKEDGALPVPGAQALIPGLKEYLNQLSPEDTDGVLFTFDTHVPEVYENSEEGKMFPIHCVAGSEGWKLVVDKGDVSKEIPTYTLIKGVFNMWEEEGIRINLPDGEDASREFFFAHLKARGITEVELVGVAADFCVKWAVDGLLENGFKARVRKDLTAGIERQIDQVKSDDWANLEAEIV